MRLRFAVLACALAALACAAGPSMAGAAPVHNRGLTIHALPNDIIAGEAVLIYGQLKGPDHAGQTIVLHHRINPNASFSVIGRTTTNANGQYEFIRPDGILLTNRSWFVRGPGFTHSRTVHEHVAALVSLAASSPGGLTRQPIVFSGHLTPDHIGSIVALQEQNDTGTATGGSPSSAPSLDRGPTSTSPTPGVSRAHITSGSCSGAMPSTAPPRRT